MIFIQLLIQILAVPGIIVLTIWTARMYAEMWRIVLEDKSND